MRDDFSDVRDLLRAALPEPDERELAAMRAGLHERLAREEQTRRRAGWWWILAPATLLTACALMLVLWPKREPPVRQTQPVPLAAEPLAGHALVLPAAARHHRTARHGMRVKPGMREAAVLVAADGSSRLRIDTTDPNVVILIPLSEKTDAEQN